MDLFKGIELKLLALERVLDYHPEWRGRLVLVQVTNAPRCVPGCARFGTVIPCLAVCTQFPFPRIQIGAKAAPFEFSARKLWHALDLIADVPGPARPRISCPRDLRKYAPWHDLRAGACFLGQDSQIQHACPLHQQRSSSQYLQAPSLALRAGPLARTCRSCTTTRSAWWSASTPSTAAPRTSRWSGWSAACPCTRRLVRRNKPSRLCLHATAVHACASAARPTLHAFACSSPCIPCIFHPLLVLASHCT